MTTKKLEFSTTIKAPKETVWKVLWNDDTYRMWTSAFKEGSYAVSDWNEGSKVLFLSPEGEGMYSIIERKIPNEYMSFKHLGVLKEGKEQPPTDETSSWSGAMENYQLSEENGITTLTVELDTMDEWADYFNQTFPKALDKVKEIAEKDKPGQY